MAEYTEKNAAGEIEDWQIVCLPDPLFHLTGYWLHQP